MGQRINIQYSVDIDDLHEEVERMLLGAWKTLDSIADIPSDTWPSGVLSLEAIENIDTLRQELARIDFTLRDASTIIGAYVAYKANMATQEMDVLPENEPAEEINEVAS
jgi:hypothetical protein